MPSNKMIAALALLPLMALSACNAAPDSALETRVQAMEDELAIKRVITDYSAAIDARDYDGYVGLFTQDGIWANGATRREGHAEIREMLEGLFGDVDPDYVNLASFHFISNFEVNVDGDNASAKSRFIFFMRGTSGEPTPELSGQYHDKLIRLDGEWKISERVDHTVMPTSEEWVAEIEARGLGTID